MKLATIVKNIKNLKELDFADIKYAGKEAFKGEAFHEGAVEGAAFGTAVGFPVGGMGSVVLDMNSAIGLTAGPAICGGIGYYVGGCINAMGVLKKEVLQGLKDIKHIQEGGEVVQGFVNHGELQKGFIMDKSGEYRFSPHALKYHQKIEKKTNSANTIDMLK